LHFESIVFSVNHTFLSFLLIICLHSPLYNQEITNSKSQIPLDTSQFYQFLDNLPDTSSAKIYAIQNNLKNAKDTLSKYAILAEDAKTKLLESRNQEEAQEKLYPFIENLGFLGGELESLQTAITNLQTSDAVDFELAYILEIETMLLEEMDKLSMPNINISENKSVLKHNSEDLSDYTFEVHPQTKAKSGDFKDCSLKTVIDDKTYTPLRHLFDYTPDKLKDHFTENDYISSLAQVVKSDKNYFFNIQIKIHSSLARDTYGGIEKGSALRIEMINGDKIILYNLKRDFGVFNQETEKMVYNLVYRIKTDDLKSLEKLDIDKIGVIWTTGYEDYEIFETDFLIKHINCLQSKN